MLPTLWAIIITVCIDNYCIITYRATGLEDRKKVELSAEKISQAGFKAIVVDYPELEKKMRERVDEAYLSRLRADR